MSRFNISTELSFSPLNLAKIFYIFFVFSLFFSVRFVFPSKEAYLTGQFSDFTAISLYLSDILLIITCLFTFIPRGEGKFRMGWPLYFLITWLILEIIFNFDKNSFIFAFFMAKFVELIVAYETTIYLSKKTTFYNRILKFFVFLSSIESVLGLYQFFFQKSLGLQRFGEQLLDKHLLGLAKIVSGGTVWLRSYGTFPHPNVFSAFLVVSLLFCLYLFVNADKRNGKIVYGLAMFLNLAGLITTFSRTAFLAATIGVVLFSSFILLTKTEYVRSARKNLLQALLLLFVYLIFLCFLFYPYLLARATTAGSGQFGRKFYAKVGINLIESRPLFGFGPGESLLHMEQFSPVKLWPWEIQPIHNYFLLAAADFGLPGAIILLIFIFWHLIKICYSLKLADKRAGYRWLLFVLLVCVLVLMQFDHYFYTLQQGQLLLWVILGLAAAEIKSPAVAGGGAGK